MLVEVPLDNLQVARVRTEEQVERIADERYRACLLYTSRAHETVLDLVCRLLLEKKTTTPSLYIVMTR